MSESGWIGVDLDGTLAEYAGWKGPDHIGAPIPLMVERVKAKISEGVEIRIVTARVGCSERTNEDGVVDGSDFAFQQAALISDWCEKHIGRRLKVTASKDFAMIELWDDRAIQFVMNTGVREGMRWVKLAPGDKLPINCIVITFSEGPPPFLSAPRSFKSQKQADAEQKANAVTHYLVITKP